MTHCLVIDDSHVMRAVAQRIFEDLGFETREAADHEAALAAFREAVPDVALIDGDMPDADGDALVRALRELPGGDGVLILYMTTENEVARITRALEAGANDFLMKPIDRETVGAKLIELGFEEPPQSAAS
jgi:two-component system chemotaxis response regulator CheY